MVALDPEASCGGTRIREQRLVHHRTTAVCLHNAVERRNRREIVVGWLAVDQLNDGAAERPDICEAQRCALNPHKSRAASQGGLPEAVVKADI